MIKEIYIKNFKSIGEQNFELKPLTIITGLNSTGKSSVLQCLLLLSHRYSTKNIYLASKVTDKFSDFTEIRNKYRNASEIIIKANATSGEEYPLNINIDISIADARGSSGNNLNYEENFYYIPSNRTGQEDIAKFSHEEKIGLNGEYIFGYFEKNKGKILDHSLVEFPESVTLQYQLMCWLKGILGVEMELKTEKITSTDVKVFFNSDGIDNITPFNLGAGNSYVAKILIACLVCNIGDTIMIENPEIHLHPKAQSKLGEFFAWISSKGIQVIIETHSEHLINKIRYQVYDKQLKSTDVSIYYKPSIQEEFISIRINANGHYVDLSDKRISFPSGFFDSTLEELLEIG